MVQEAQVFACTEHTAQPVAQEEQVLGIDISMNWPVGQDVAQVFVVKDL